MNHAPGAERLKVVLDSNIYIAAFEFPHGKNAVVWVAARTGLYQLIVSPAIISETARVLRSVFGWEDDRVQQIIRRVAEVGRVVTPSAIVRAFAADPTTTAF